MTTSASRSYRPPGWLLAFLIYLALGVVLWWHAWSGGPSSSIPGGSGDPEQDVWFLAWALHALVNGDNPFFSQALYARQGVNLLVNPSILALGVLFAPVTALFGPIVAFNVAVTIAPAASALAAFFAVNRLASWRPAAFVGGLCYGFSPFVATDLRFGHLHLTFLVVPPLILIMLHELLVRQRRGPVRVGVMLGLLTIVQFFISTEVLALTVIVALIGIVLLAITHPRESPARARLALTGVLTALTLSLVVLAYPMWVIVAGPRHITGPALKNLDNLTATLAAAVVPHGERFGVLFVSGGNGSYLGAPLLLLLVAALWIWREPALRFAVAMAAMAYVLALGPRLYVTRGGTGIPLPSAVFQHLPLLDSIVPSRFGAFVDFFAGMALAIVLDRVHAGDFGALARHLQRRDAARSGPLPPLPAAVAGAVAVGGTRRPLAAVAGAVAVVAVVPLLWLPPWPYPVRHVVEPPVLRQRSFTAAAPGSIVREYPPVLVADAAPLLWQAVDGINYDLDDGYAIVPGDGGRATEKPPVDALSLVFTAAALGTLKLPLSASADVAIRDVLSRDHIMALVVLGSTSGSAVVLAALRPLLGRPTERLDGAVVWFL